MCTIAIHYFLKFIAEPKPSRSSNSSNDSGSNCSSNYGADDRYGGGHDMLSHGDCALHVICSPMVNITSIFPV